MTWLRPSQGLYTSVRESCQTLDIPYIMILKYFPDVFHENMKPAIGSLIDAVGDSDRNVWSTAISVISKLSGTGSSMPYIWASKFRTWVQFSIDTLREDLIPAVPKLIQKLSGVDEDEKYPLQVIQALSNLASYSKVFFHNLEPSMLIKWGIRRISGQAKACRPHPHQVPGRQVRSSNWVFYTKQNMPVLIYLILFQILGRNQ